MIYSVDSSVLLDMLLPDPTHGISSKEVLNRASEKGKLIICPIVYAELCPQFERQVSLDAFLKETGIRVLPFTRETLWMAGKVWKSYISRGGKKKDRILPDFLIGAFSSIKAGAIITRDKDFYKRIFRIKVSY